jgi:hypothetical protein
MTPVQLTGIAMNKLLSCFVVGLFLTTTPLWADNGIREQQVQFKKGTSATSIKGKIKGDQTVDYLLTAKAGQTMVAKLTTSNRSAYFNVLPQGAGEAIFIGSSAGDKFEGALPADGTYAIRVYLMRNASRRNETANYRLDVSIKGAARAEAIAPEPAAVAAGAFDKTLELHGIKFRVTSANMGSINELRIAPSGLEIDNSPMVKQVDGSVTGAEVADLNVDGSPEIYVYVRSAGSGSYGSLVAYASNRRKSLSEIVLPDLLNDANASKGYQGHDEFAVVESILARRFPLYRHGDINAKPTGGMRQLQYKLFPGEASWALKVDRITDF